MPQQTATCRRGLVLAGGGAKGAYAFGCLLTLKRLGISFDVVAGTSVGALNAALWSSGSMRRGIKIWRDISFGTTYPPKLLRPPVPRLLIWVFGAVFVCFHLARATVERRLNPATHVYSALLAILVSVTALALFWMTSWMSPNRSIEWVYVSMVVGVGLAFLNYRRFSTQRNNVWREAALQIVVAGYVGICTVTIPIGTNIGKEIWPGPGLGSPMRLLPVVALGVIGSLLLALVLAGPVHLAIAVLRAFRRFLDSRTILATGPLTELLHATLTGTTWKCPTFATIASSREVFLTNEWTDTTAEDVAKSLNVTTADLSRDFVKSVEIPVTQRVWVPVYERLDGRPMNEAVEIILASAALPFGLVPHVTRNGEHYVDGGVADNVPWFPALDFELDELIIILLKPYDSEASAIAELNVCAQGWSDRLNALLDFEAPIPPALLPEDIEELRRQTEWIRSRRGPFPYEHFPVVRVLYPSRALGGFLRGTMNFDGEYARELMRLGMKDTYARFRP